MKTSNVIPIKMIGGTNFARYPKITQEATINMMVTTADDIEALVNYSGYKKIISFINGEPRQIYTSTILNEMIVIVGKNVYLINSSLTSRLLGILDSFEGEVYISENQNKQIGIIDNLGLYIYDYSSSPTFSRIPLADIIPNYISFLDTYFILSDKTNGFFQLSNSNDGTTYNALMRATLQTQADQIQAVIPLDRTVWVLGKKVSELWNDNPTAYAIGNPVSFPFQRNNSFSIGYGVLSIQSIAVGFGMLVWVAFNASSGPTIVYTTGGKPTEISSDGLDYILKNLTAPQDCTGILFQQSNHIIYQVNFYTDNFSVAYDFKLGFWYVVTDENLNHHIAKRMVYFNGSFYFINFDEDNPGLYEMNSNITTYDDVIIPRIRVSPPLRELSQPMILENFILNMELGTSSGSVDMSISKDGGIRYGNVVRRNMNPIGKRRGYITWKGSLGICDDFRLQHRFITDGRVVVLGASAGVRQ